MTCWLLDFFFFSSYFVKETNYDMTIGLHGPIGWPKCNKNTLFQMFLLLCFISSSALSLSDAKLVIPGAHTTDFLLQSLCFAVMNGSIVVL